MTTRILVVDDASFIRDMMKKNLRDSITGVEVYEATDGQEALTIVKEHQIDLILSDWEMPNMSGEELLRTLRSGEESPDTPFIMVSTRGNREHVVKAVEAGVTDYLSKPFTHDELLRKVTKQLGRVGKAPKSAYNGSTQGIAASSVGVLTGKGEGSAASTGKKSKGRAGLSFASQNEACNCVIRDLSLQTLTGLVQRTDSVPALFEQVVVKLQPKKESAQLDLNGYVHGVQAAEGRPDTSVIKVVIRFVDQNSEKFDALSRFIAER